VVASPVLVGAVTVLVVIVAVFLAYNANQGLPFVPSYELKAEIPGGENLVKGNEVRVGGFRVGLVSAIEPKVVTERGHARAVALIEMKLDKKVEPLARDTRLLVRPRSALGLKYVELTPGRSRATYPAGATIPLANARQPVELDELLNTFDDETRDNSRLALEGYGDAFAARGPDLNAAIQSLAPFFRHLDPVARNLASPRTRLKDFFEELGNVAAQVAPVAEVQAELFTNMADTFAAISHNPAALQQTIEKSPPTLDATISSLRVQRPFLADFAIVSRRLRPAVRELPKALPGLNAALRTGSPVLKRSPPLSDRTANVFHALDDLVGHPSTLLALNDLGTTTKVTKPLVEFVAPNQIVCDYLTYFFTVNGNHFAEPVKGGTAELVSAQQASPEQDNGPNDTTNSERPSDIPANQDGTTTKDSEGNYLAARHGQPYASAIDAQGNADCENGQRGYLEGPWIEDSRFGHARYPPSNDPTKGGGSHVVGLEYTPGLQGGTYASRRLGIKNLRDVP
jgi:phospholipid/cholesterol/gamma-HCH transport system substrate-binding protein